MHILVMSSYELTNWGQVRGASNCCLTAVYLLLKYFDVQLQYSKFILSDCPGVKKEGSFTSC